VVCVRFRLPVHDCCLGNGNIHHFFCVGVPILGQYQLGFYHRYIASIAIAVVVVAAVIVKGRRSGRSCRLAEGWFVFEGSRWGRGIVVRLLFFLVCNSGGLWLVVLVCKSFLLWWFLLWWLWLFLLLRLRLRLVPKDQRIAIQFDPCAGIGIRGTACLCQ